MPGKIILSTTADGATSPTERFRITSKGDIVTSSRNANVKTYEFSYTDGAGGSGQNKNLFTVNADGNACLLYTSPSPRDRQKSRMPSSA